MGEQETREEFCRSPQPIRGHTFSKGARFSELFRQSVRAAARPSPPPDFCSLVPILTPAQRGVIYGGGLSIPVVVCAARLFDRHSSSCEFAAG
jgi:hypothetical protein